MALVRLRLPLVVVERRQGPAGWTKMGGCLVVLLAKAKKGLKMTLPR